MQATNAILERTKYGQQGYLYEDHPKCSSGALTLSQLDAQILAWFTNWDVTVDLTLFTPGEKKLSCGADREKVRQRGSGAESWAKALRADQGLCKRN